MKKALNVCLVSGCLLFAGSLFAAMPQEVQSSYTGYYVFDGKMYYYNQDTGEFSPLSESSGVKGDDSYSASPKGDVAYNELIPADSPGSDYRKPRLLASLSNYGQDSSSSGCKNWGSPLLSSKTYRLKDDCDSDLENALDEMAVVRDKYVDNFEKGKRALLITSSLEEFEKLKQVKLAFPISTETMTAIKKSGCVCMD